MTSTRVLNQAGGALALTLFSLVGCNAIVGLDQLKIGEEPTDFAGSNSGGRTGSEAGNAGNAGKGGSNTNSEAGSGTTPGGEAGAGGEGGEGPQGDCTTNQECTDRLTQEAMGKAGGTGTAEVAAACVKSPIPHCVKLLSEDCDGITGDYLNNRAIFVGSLFSTKGPTAATNLVRQQAAALGIEQINMAGGIPTGSTSANGRPLVMVSCDESTNLIRAATHLVNDLHVPAIVGPNTSQDTLDVSTNVTVPGGTVVMSPTGVASSIASLSDNDLTWLMVPSDVQRAPLMISQVGELEKQLKAERTKETIDLGIIFRNDALGIGTRTALDGLKVNGQSLANNPHVKIDPYSGSATDADYQALASKYVTFLPDIIVLAGTPEAIKLMEFLEKDWPKDGSPRPYYVLIDSSKVKELLTLANPNAHDLRRRVRGTGITPGPGGPDTPAATYDGFLTDFAVRYKLDKAPEISGIGPAHDAAYAIGLALAATRSQEVSGASVAQGLRKLAGGATRLKANGINVLAAFQKLSAGEKITLVGTFGILDWDANGAVQGGTLEMWCIGGSSETAAWGNSTLLFDIKTQTMSGSYVPCTP
ncbi:MAG TPA: ABC transporter substrate-binding protein [Polyangiaceae bacterium]|nr:ABC transporter substrate-binding protein [Polyangiaceae bacterium]